MMKKLMFVLWMCVLFVPSVLMFTTAGGGASLLNVAGVLYTAVLLANFRKVVPEYMMRYIDKITDIA